METKSVSLEEAVVCVCMEGEADAGVSILRKRGWSVVGNRHLAVIT